MQKQILIFIIFILFNVSLKAQEIDNNKSKKDTIFEYFDNGKIKAWFITDSTSVLFMNVINKGNYDKMYGEYIPIEGTEEILRIGTWKWYTSEGRIKDSLIYKNGAMLYSARFYNDGTLHYENNSGKLLESNTIIEKCDIDFIIRFKNKNMFVLESMILPYYQEHGFYIVKNGVYDFIINGKKYFQAVVLNINENGFYISKDWNFVNYNQTIKDSTFININSTIQIRLLNINNGVGGIPTRIKTEDYDVQIINTNKYCKLLNAEFISKEGKTTGHYYFTGYGLKNLKMKKGIPYLCEKTGDYLLRRK